MNDTLLIENIIVKKKRGEILHYSIDQVATLLNETETSIKYYTNIFSKYLNPEVINQRLVYHKNDIFKLELLIDLKLRGVHSNQIDCYINDSSYSPDDIYFDASDSSNLYSEFVNEIDKKHDELLTKIKVDINTSTNTFSNSTEKQEFVLNQLSANITHSLDSINDKLENMNNHDINNSINVQLNNNSSLNDTIFALLSSFEKSRIEREDLLLKEIQKTKHLLTTSHNLQVALDEYESNKNWFGKLFTKKLS